MTLPYGLGHRPSPPDKVGLGSPPPHILRAAPLPASASLRGHVVEVLNQGQTSACVAHATAQAVRTRLSAQGVVAPLLPSRLHIYYIARAETGDQNVDEGTYVASAVDAISKLGYPPEIAYPFSEDPAVINAQPPWEDFREALDQKLVNGAYRISSVGQQRVADVKAALAGGHPVIFGTDVDNAIFDVVAGQIWPGCVGPSVGGHALMICGYAPGHFELCNSWGSDYADEGFFLASEAAIASSLATDFWVLQVAQPFSEVA